MMGDLRIVFFCVFIYIFFILVNNYAAQKNKKRRENIKNGGLLIYKQIYGYWVCKQIKKKI